MENSGEDGIPATGERFVEYFEEAKQMQIG
jgi:hypothetical protein